MGEPLHFTDLRTIDRDVARAVTAWGRWTRAVADDPAANEDVEPLEPWRHVAGQSAYLALGELTPSALDVPLRDGLRRWVYALMQWRIGRENDAEWATAAAEPAARYMIGRVRHVSWRESWRELLAAPTHTEAAGWLDAAASRGPALASIARRRRERRVEVARRLGLGHPEEGATSATHGALLGAASIFLTATDDVASMALRDARTRADRAHERISPVDAVRSAVGRDAPEGWPPGLHARWIDETLGGLGLTKGLHLPALALPPAIGASSFARALAAFGYAFRTAGASPSLPFALARDPYFTAAHRFAFVFGALPSAPAFQRRVLGLAPGTAHDQARVLVRTALFEARLGALRFLLADHPAQHEDLTARLLGTPAPEALAGAWPRARDDEPARLLALFTAEPFARDLVDRFDEDWFKNPRVAMHLRAIASAPAREADPPPDLDAAARDLARSFERALG